MIINSKLCPQLRWNNTNFLLLSWLALFIIQLDFVVMCSFSRCYIDTHSHMEPFRGGKAWGSGKGQKAWDPFSLIFFILYFHLDPKNRMINWQHNIITREIPGFSFNFKSSSNEEKLLSDSVPFESNGVDDESFLPFLFSYWHVSSVCLYLSLW